MQTHILNGDNLKTNLINRFENIFVMGEALIQGPVSKDNFIDFLDQRADFISKEYKVCKKQEYLKVTEEFIKIQNIPADTEINFWFGTDLFCQVNFWFLVDLLKEKIDTNRFFLVLPQENQNCSFGDKKNIDYSLKNKILLSKNDLNNLVKLWQLFRKNNLSKIEEKRGFFEKNFPFIKDSIRALLEKQIVENEIKIMAKKEDDFIKLFKKISQKYSIYGYGDLQIKYIISK